jgi:lipocalin
MNLKFFNPFLLGPYWVIAAGPTYDNYEWALVSGGQPTIPTENGCRTGTSTNGSGLWIFSRTQVAPKWQIELVREIAEKNGFDISVLQTVQQEGCTYYDYKGYC